MDGGSLTRRGFLKAAGAALGASVVLPACESNPLKTTITVEKSAKDFSAVQGVVPPLLTPFKADLSVDYEALDALIDWHVSAGVNSIFVVSGSGEYFDLTEDEAAGLATAALARAADIPVLAGASNHMAYTKELFATDQNNVSLWEQDLADNTAMMRRIEATGVHACVATTPRVLPRDLFQSWTENDFFMAHVVRPFPDHPDYPLYERLLDEYDAPMLEYHETLHDAVRCNVLGYEKPGNIIGYKFSPEAFSALGAKKRFVAIKDSTTSVDAVGAKLDAAEGTIKVLDANTPNLLQTYQLGATGCINTTSNVVPDLLVRLLALIDDGSMTDAAELHSRIVSIDEMLMGWGYVMSAKVALNLMGLPIEPVTRDENPPDFFSTSNSERLQTVKDMVALIEQTRSDFGIAAPVV